MRRRGGGRAPDYPEIQEARGTIASLLAPSPMVPAPALGAGGDLRLKAENLQVAGSFKIRGAYNRISRLRDGRGVIAASAGNHAQGVALAASRCGLPSVIVMPEETPLIKVERTRAYGAEVILHGALFEDAHRKALEIRRKRRLTFVHAYEDRDVIAGQGTIGLEILEAFPDVQAIVVPVGGGGLISGIAIAAKAMDPDVAVIGVQARGAAPAVRSFRTGGGRAVALTEADTIADAIRFKKTSPVTMPIIASYVDDMVEVSDEEISETIVRLMEDCKLVAEGAGAVAVAAILAGRIPKRHRRVCAVVSGGNIDLNMITRVVEQGLSRENRFLVLRCQVPDKPGRLFGVLAHLADRRINVLDVRHNRAGWRIPLGRVEVELLVETRNARHAEEILGDLKKAGYAAVRAERPAGSR